MRKYHNLFLTLSLLATSACFQFDSVPYTGGGSGAKPPFTGPDPYDHRSVIRSPRVPYYPTYDPNADNPHRDFSPERYEGYKYPKYNPADDNPYYPPSTYAPPARVAPAPPAYRYPTYNPEADNPSYGDTFNEPIFDRPLFEN